MCMATILRMRGGEPAALGDRLRQIATDSEPDVRVGARSMTLVYQQDKLALRLVTGVLTIVVLDTLSDGTLLGGKGKILLPAVSLMMVTAGVLAVVGPARRALRIQPIEALREE